jgi:hypothetical protein
VRRALPTVNHASHADLEREKSNDEQDDSDGEVFARKAPDGTLQA